MSLRIIAGRFGGRTIATSDSFKTHPMGDRIRSSLFNILGDLDGLTVLDAFAGSGSLGLESLSRGAAHVTFIERDRLAQDVIMKNIEMLGVADDVRLIKGSIAQWDTVAAAAEAEDTPTFDLIFADPPYGDLQPSTIARLAMYLQSDGQFVLSWPGKQDLPEIPSLSRTDTRSYGDAQLGFYMRTHL